jgi:hypothetical protein
MGRWQNLVVDVIRWASNRLETLPFAARPTIN